MKKNLILSAALLLSATAAMAQSGTFTLKANMKNFGDTVIVFKNRGGAALRLQSQARWSSS